MNTIYRLALSIPIALVIAAVITSTIVRGDHPTNDPTSQPANQPTTPARPTWRSDARANTDASGLAQQEPSLAINRRNPDVIVVAAKDFRMTENISRSVWIYTSHDGGRTWPWNQRFPQVSDDIVRHSDPVAVARDDGRLYVIALGSGTPIPANHGLFITWSDDDGITWHDAVTVTAQRRTFFDDKEWLAIDQSPRSPTYQRMVVAWRPSRFDALWSTYSVDGGLTWADPISAADGDIHSAYPVFDANGRLLLFFIDPLKIDEPGTIRFVTSDDGGDTFSLPHKVVDVRQPRSPLNAGDRFRVLSILSAAIDSGNPDRIYVAWTDARDVGTSGADAMLAVSHDSGATWSAPIRLSSDPPGHARDDFLPVIHVGARSRLHAFWMDRRGDPDNALVNAVYRASDDGGVTWGPSSRVSDVATDFNVAVPPNSPSLGEYWGLDSVGNRVCAAWADTRSGNEDIYVDCAWMADLGFMYYLPVMLHEG